MLISKNHLIYNIECGIDYAWWNGDSYVVLTQDGDTPVLSYFNRFTLLKSLKIDHQDRNSDMMQAITVKNWFEDDYIAYYAASVKFNSDGTQYPWLSAFNATGQSFKFSFCLNTNLIGAYNKDSNLNYVPAHFASDSRGRFFRIAIRSQTYGGI